MISIVNERRRERIGNMGMPDYTALVDDWRSLYRSIFGYELSDTIGLFSRPRALTYGIVVPRWMTLDLALAAVQGFGIRVRNGLGRLDTPEYALSNRRDPQRHGGYAIWVSGGLLPDADLMGVRGMELVEQGIETMTLVEYLLFVVHHFVRHGWEHQVDRADPRLGTRHKMLCAGTENTRGNMPLAYDDEGDFALTVAHPYPDKPDILAGSRRVYADPHVFG